MSILHCPYCGTNHEHKPGAVSFACPKCAAETQMLPDAKPEMIEEPRPQPQAQTQPQPKPQAPPSHYYSSGGSIDGFDRVAKIAGGLVMAGVGIFILSSNATVMSFLAPVFADGPAGSVESAVAQSAMPWVMWSVRIFGGMTTIGGLMSTITGFTAA